MNLCVPKKEQFRSVGSIPKNESLQSKIGDYKNDAKTSAATTLSTNQVDQRAEKKKNQNDFS